MYELNLELSWNDDEYSSAKDLEPSHDLPVDRRFWFEPGQLIPGKHLNEIRIPVLVYVTSFIILSSSSCHLELPHLGKLDELLPHFPVGVLVYLGRQFEQSDEDKKEACRDKGEN